MLAPIPQDPLVSMDNLGTGIDTFWKRTGQRNAEKL